MNINGKVPPSDIEMEKALIGSLICQPLYLESILEFMNHDDFYDNKHIIIFEALERLFDKSINIDAVNITQYIRQNGNLDNVGGSFYISELMDYDSFDVLFKGRIVKQHSIYRNVINLCYELQNKAYEANTDSLNLVSYAIDTFSKLIDFTQKNEVFKLNQVITKIIQNIDLQEKGLLKETVFKTCLKFMDFYGGGVAVIAAKPGSGKTALMLSCAKVQAKSQKKVGILSIEMNEILLTARIIQEQTKVSGKTMLTYKLDEQTKKRVYECDFFDLPIFINTCHDLNDKNLYQTISMMVRKFGCEIIYIDYLQLMESENMRDTELQKNSNIMKTCAKASKFFNIPIIILCQMSRGEITIENLDEKLRGGGIEQGASQIFGIDYVDITEQKKSWNEQDENKRGIFKIINSKDRNESPFGEKYFFFNQPKQVIEDVREMFEVKKDDRIF